MKFLVLIAMVALCGCSSLSPDADELGALKAVAGTLGDEMNAQGFKVSRRYGRFLQRPEDLFRDLDVIETRAQRSDRCRNT